MHNSVEFGFQRRLEAITGREKGKDTVVSTGRVWGNEYVGGVSLSCRYQEKLSSLRTPKQALAFYQSHIRPLRRDCPVLNDMQA